MKITTTKQLDPLEYIEKVIEENGLIKNDFTVSSILKLFKFLKTEVQLNHFIPAKKVDGKWEVLDPVIKMDYGIDTVPGYPAKHPIECYVEDLKEYQEAQEDVLFKGDWLIDRDDRYTNLWWLSDQKQHKTIPMHECKTIQDLIPLDLELTQNAIQKL